MHAHSPYAASMAALWVPGIDARSLSLARSSPKRDPLGHNYPMREKETRKSLANSLLLMQLSLYIADNID
jgi:hypothetical protein